MMDVLVDAWKDTAAMVPFLLAVYVALELIERRFERATSRMMRTSRAAGPLLGALLGCIPQCGFSVIATTFYTQRAISLGTLLAVYLSTSDEALPVILAHPERAGLVLPILLTKVMVAILAGYAVDFIFGRVENKKREEAASPVCVHPSHCCEQGHSAGEPWWKSYVIHPAWHTLRVLVFIFAVSLAINLIILNVGEENLGKIFLGGTLFQPLAAALVGLIPNCVASVAITQIFLEGGISFGSAMAGLCASAGLGLLVLFRENKDMRDTLKVVGLLVGISYLAGIVVNHLW